VRNPVDRLTTGLPHSLRVAIDWVVTLAGAITVVLLLKAFVVNPYRIPSSSMEPTLHCARPGQGCEAGRSDRVLANRMVYHLREPRRGDVVVFETPAEAWQVCGAGGTFVKRLVGLPGETVSERNGMIYIDDRRLDEPYVQPTRRDDESGRWEVEPDHYFFMGDNRRNSCDSRRWGAVPRENLIGTVFATYWPPSRIAVR
jgi:signal peptidase I